MLLIDTSVVAYLLIEGDHSVSAQELWRRDPDWRSEALLLVELTNVLAASIATNRMTSALAEDFWPKRSLCHTASSSASLTLLCFRSPFAIA